MRDDGKKAQNVRLIELPSPFPRAPGTLWLIEPPEGFGAPPLERWREGTLGRPFIFDSGSMRHLFFNARGTQSSMRLDEPDALVHKIINTVTYKSGIYPPPMAPWRPRREVYAKKMPFPHRVIGC